MSAVWKRRGAWLSETVHSRLETDPGATAAPKNEPVARSPFAICSGSMAVRKAMSPQLAPAPYKTGWSTIQHLRIQLQIGRRDYSFITLQNYSGRRVGRSCRIRENPVRDRTLPSGPAQRQVQRKKTCDSMQLLSAPHSASYEFICLTFSPLPLPVLSTWPWWPGWSPCACCFFAFAWPSWCSDSEPSRLLLPAVWDACPAFVPENH